MQAYWMYATDGNYKIARDCGYILGVLLPEHI